MQLVKATPRSGYSVLNPETDMSLLAVGEWVELNNYWRRRFLDKEVFIDGWIDGENNPGSALDSKNYFGMRAYASVSDLMLQTAAEFGEMAWVTDDTSDRNGYYRFDRNKQWVKLDEQNFGDLYDYLGRAEQAKIDAEMYAAAALENGGAASIAAEQASTSSNAAASSANTALGFATAANASSDAALGFASAANTAAQKAQTEVGKIEGFSTTAKSAAQNAASAAQTAKIAAESASNFMNEVENSKQFVADMASNIEVTIADLTASKKILSANLAVENGNYYTNGDVPTENEYSVSVIRGMQGETDWIWQTAAKDGTIFTRDCALIDLASTTWAGTKDSQITILDGRTQRQFNQYIDVRKAGSFYDVRDFGVLATEGVLAMTAAEVAAMKDWGAEIRTILNTLKSPFTLYIPFGVKWKKTDTSSSLGTDLYDAMPDGCRIIDNSGYEDRYANKFFQATSYEINKTYAYDEVNNTDKTGQTNGNTHNIRASYHPAYCSETDAPRYTAGCRSSIVFRLNNTKKSGEHSSNKYASDMFQLSADYTVKGQENFGFSSYGDISPGGTRIFRHGAQDSIAPTSFAFNSLLVAGASFIIGKKQRDPIGELVNVNWDDPADIASKKAAAVAVKDAEWKASGHVVKYSQPSRHTGTFVSMWDVNGVLWLRRDIALNGDITYTTKTGNAFKITTDAVLSGLRKNVIAPISSIALTLSQSGSIIHNGSATGGFVVTLPKASAGISYLFYVLNASNLRVQPNAADNFIGLAAGVFKQSSAIGAVLVITAISATQWIIETETGAWTTA